MAGWLVCLFVGAMVATWVKVSIVGDFEERTLAETVMKYFGTLPTHTLAESLQEKANNITAPAAVDGDSDADVRSQRQHALLAYMLVHLLVHLRVCLLVVEVHADDIVGADAVRLGVVGVCDCRRLWLVARASRWSSSCKTRPSARVLTW